ncbi:hypothetical protein GCM10017744_033620 [Streptomyces antimycoticus]
MVEGERGGQIAVATEGPVLVEERFDGGPAHAVRVTSGPWRGQIGCQREVRHADHAHSGVPLRIAVGGELLEMSGVRRDRKRGVMGEQPGLLGQLPGSGGGKIFIGPHETAG